MYKDKLPDSLAELLEMSLRDLQHVEKLPNYVIDMSFWHYPIRGTDQCMVCMAGAALAMEYGTPTCGTLALPNDPVQSDRPPDAPPVIHVEQRLWDKMKAINMARVGDLDMAYRYLYGEPMSAEQWQRVLNLAAKLGGVPVNTLHPFTIYSYEHEREQFYTQMYRMIEICRNLDI